MNRQRVAALVAKEWLDVRRNPGVLVPVAIVSLVALLLPFVIAVAIPAWTGDPLADDADLRRLGDRGASTISISGEARVQFFLFQQFFLLFLLTPITGAMALAAHSIVGEKQARTLEPLLATPITTFELLAAKVLGSLLPAIALTVACFTTYIALVALVARPGVFSILLTPRSLAVVFVLGPLAALAALQLAVCVSSRVNDPRSAQQIGALIILPISGLLIAQLTGAVLLTVPVILFLALILAGVNTGLMLVGIALFDRESILTRWK
jgi:ABC-2 type transport system permease protein